MIRPAKAPSAFTFGRRAAAALAFATSCVLALVLASSASAIKYYDSAFPFALGPGCTTSGCTGASALGGYFGVPRDIAVRHSTGQIFVVEQGNHRIQRLAADGSFQRAWGGDVIQGGAEGTGTVTSGSTSVTAVATTRKAFVVGQTVTGTGIEPGTRITAVAATTLTLSQAATPAATGAGTVLTVAEGSGNVSTNEIQTVTLAAGVTSGNFKLKFTAPNPQSVTAAQTTANIPFNATAEEVENALEALTNIGAGNVAVTSSNPGGGAAPGGPYAIEFKGSRYADTNVTTLTRENGSPNLAGGSATVATQREGATAFEVCTVAADCKAGLASAGNPADNLMNGSMSAPQGIDVNQTTGQVFVRDRENRRVNEYTLDGAFVRSWGFDVAQPTASPSSSAVFETCLPTDTCKVGVTGNGIGQIATATSSIPPSNQSAGVAVAPQGAPNAGELFVVDPGNARILRFDVPTNLTAPVVATAKPPIQGTEQIGANEPRFLAVDAEGVVYALASGTAQIGVARFDTTSGQFLSTILGGGGSTLLGVGPPSISGLEVDPGTGRLFVSRTSGAPGATGPGGVIELDVSGKPATIDAENVVGIHGTGLHIGAPGGIPNGIGLNPVTGELLISTDAAGVVGGITGSGHRILVLDDTGVDPPPTTVLLPAQSVEAATATLQAEINPNGPTGFTTFYRFQLSKDAGVTWFDATADASIGDGGSLVPVSNPVTALEPNTLYQLRVRTQRNPDAGVSFSGTLSFQTDPAPPIVETVATQRLTNSSAELVGRMNPGGIITTYWFEWGETASYGNTVPVPEGSTTGSLPRIFVEGIEGLDPQSTYHFRFCAQNALSPTPVCGLDKSFTVRAGAPTPEGRAYEMVTSPDKVLRRGGERELTPHDYSRFQGILPAPDGESAMWQLWAGVIDPDAGTGIAPSRPHELRSRAPSGWRGEAVLKVAPFIPVTAYQQELPSISADLRTQTVWTSAAHVQNSQTAVHVMGDGGGPRGAGWYPLVDPAWTPNSSLYGQISSLMADDGRQFVADSSDPGLREVPPTDGGLAAQALSPPQSVGRALLRYRAPNWTPDDLVNECTGAGAGSTAIPTRGDNGTEAGPAGTFQIFGSYTSGNPLVNLEFLSAGTVKVGHTVTAGAGLVGSKVVAINSPTTFTVSPAPTATAPAFTTIEGGQAVANFDDDKIAGRPCGEGSPVDVRGGRISLGVIGAMSEDGSRIFFSTPDVNPKATCAKEIGAATDCPPQLFVRQYDDSGAATVRWISRAEDALFNAPRPPGQQPGQQIALIGQGAFFEGASTDGSSVYFRTNAPLTVDDPNGAGVAPPVGGVVDGTASPTSWDLYRYELPGDNNIDPAGGELTRISGGPGSAFDPNTNCATAAADCGSTNNGAAAALRFLSDDGERAYFATAAPIGVGADPWNEAPEGSATTNLPGGTAASNTATRNLYLYDAGSDAYKFIARIPYGAPDNSGTLDSCVSSQRQSRDHVHRVGGAGVLGVEVGGNCVRGTSSGDAIVFETTGQLTSDDTDTAGDVYLYDATADELVRLSAPPQDSSPYSCLTTSQGLTTGTCNGDLGFQGGNNGVATSFGETIGVGSQRHRNIAEDDDGHLTAVYFESRLPLTSDDLNAPDLNGNGGMDVYEWRRSGGDLQLLTPGDSADSAFYTGNSRDGRDVFFWTEQGLSWQEIDQGDGDVYDARRGSAGFPEPPAPPTCAVLAAACQGAVPTAPAAAGAASASLSGQGNVVEKPKNKKQNKKKKNKKKKQSKKKQANKTGRAGR